MREILEEKLKEIFKEKDFKLEKAPEERGDYASGIAFRVAKEEKRDPKEVAKELKEKIGENTFFQTEVAGGFLNFSLTEEALWKEFFKLLKEKEDYGKKKGGKKAVIDYSSPNVAKSFGVGHLRSTIIGQSLYNIYDFLGWDVAGINHLGDWGTQYGKLIYQIKKEEKDPEKLSIKELEELYVRFHKDEEKYPELKEEGRKWFSKLEKGDPEARRIWEICKNKSLEEFDKIYKELEIEIDHTIGESFYEDKLSEVIKETKRKGVAKESKGALIIEFDDMPPAMILKSDGGTTYFTRDLAAIWHRIKEFSPDLIIYEIGADQSLHMKQLFAATEMLGWKKSTELIHVAHGMFRLKEGKFSTRKGKTVHLKEVLELAKEKAEEIIENSMTAGDLSSEEKKEIARIVGIGAVKYNDLKRYYKRDVLFDWEQVMQLKGDSGPYLQYACLRCKSVLEKGGKYEVKEEGLEKEERRVVKKIVRFKEVTEMAATSFSPNIIAEYAYDLAREYNVFYDNLPILGNEKRMAITEGVFIVLKRCLYLLTISLPSKM